MLFIPAEEEAVRVVAEAVPSSFSLLFQVFDLRIEQTLQILRLELFVKSSDICRRKIFVDVGVHYLPERSERLTVGTLSDYQIIDSFDRVYLCI